MREQSFNVFLTQIMLPLILFCAFSFSLDQECLLEQVRDAKYFFSGTFGVNGASLHSKQSMDILVFVDMSAVVDDWSVTL